MKKLGLLMFLLALTVMLGGTALAQGVYFTTYYSANQANAPDATVRIINDGSVKIIGATPNLWAAIYVFDDSEELTQCCNCLVTPDGLLSESVKLNLTANPIRNIVNTRGVIKVISSLNGNPLGAEQPQIQPGLRVWRRTSREP